MVDCAYGIVNNGTDDGSSTCDNNDNLVYDDFAVGRYPVRNPFTKGERCAVYDPAAPAGRGFVYYGASRKKDVDVVAKLNGIKLDNNKNPVVKLNEIALIMKKTIKYEIISISGEVHTPIYTMCASSKDIVAYGNGSSKRDAKKNAATELLNMIDFSNDNNTLTSTTSNSEPIVKQMIETKFELNPIGVLQELCMAYHWELPHYECFKELCNESNKFKFIVICSLKSFRSKGVNSTKQSAKKQAACLLYDQIKNMSPEDITAHHYYVKTAKPSDILLNNNQSDNKKLITDGKSNVTEAMKYVDIFVKDLKSSTNPSINQLKILDISCKSMSAVDLLEKIGKEERFTTTYIKYNSASSVEKVLVQVSFFPLVVNLGMGNTLEEAQETAALAVLSYLQVLVKG